MQENIEFFSLKDCGYSIGQNKEKSARVVMWKMGIENSYTFEISYAGVNSENFK